MKRRNAELGKMRRPIKRNKITEGFYGSDCQKLLHSQANQRNEDIVNEESTRKPVQSEVIYVTPSVLPVTPP
ncbi:hypothetical protein Trydic_g14078 [Trypoxylus dichotomus]